DLAKWKVGFGAASGATHHAGDADSDQDVDGVDFLIWQRQLGSTSTVPASAAVPEPETLALLFAATLGVFRRPRRRARYWLLALLAGAAVPPPAQAAPLTWPASAGSLWSTASNCSPAGAPASGDSVVFTGTSPNTSPTADFSLSLDSLTINPNAVA